MKTAMRFLAIGFLFVPVLAASPAGFAIWKPAELKQRDEALSKKVGADHSARETLADYGDHRFRMLYRDADGVPEQHDHIVDVVIVQSGEGTLLLGAKAVIAESFERIHRSNLVGMGVLPLQFVDGQNRQSLELTGLEEYSIEGVPAAVDSSGRARVKVTARNNGDAKSFEAIARIDTPVEAEYYRNGGILPYVLRQLAAR